MKKYLPVLSLVLMVMCCNVLFTSCGDDDDENNDNAIAKKVFSNKDIVGTWEYTPDDAPGTISSTTFFDDGTYMNVIRDKDVDPDATDTDTEGVILKVMGKYDIVRDSLYFLRKSLYQPGKFKDSMWHPLDDTRTGLKFEFVDENNIKFYDVTNASQPETILAKNASANVEKIEVFDKRLIGTWEGLSEQGKHRYVYVFDADGYCLHMIQDTEKNTSKRYYDDNFTYYQAKGYYNAINGSLDIVQTHEWDYSWNVMDWRENKFQESVSYELIDENTLHISDPNVGTAKEDGVIEISTFTRVK